MKRIILLVVTAIMILNCSMSVCAEENITEESVVQNYEMKTRAVATDIKTITLEQVGRPTIPETPFKEDLVKDAEVIYRIRYKVTAKTVNNQVVTNRVIESITYTGPVKGSKITNINSQGIGYIDIDVRGAHNITLYCRLKSSGVKSNTVSLSVPIQAKYDKAFYCTGYYTSLESDWSGEKVAVDSLGNDAYKKAFLEDTKMNGSGKAENGKYLHYDSTKKTFSYVNPVTVTGTTPTAGRTIATDPEMFPPGALAFIRLSKPVLDREGKPTGRKISFSRFVLNQDKGAAIKGPGRVDLFCGFGEAAEPIASNLKERGELYFLIKK